MICVFKNMIASIFHFLVLAIIPWLYRTAALFEVTLGSVWLEHLGIKDHDVDKLSQMVLHTCINTCKWSAHVWMVLFSYRVPFSSSWLSWNLPCRPAWLHAHRDPPISASQLLRLKTASLTFIILALRNLRLPKNLSLSPSWMKLCFKSKRKRKMERWIRHGKTFSNTDSQGEMHF